MRRGMPPSATDLSYRKESPPGPGEADEGVTRGNSYRGKVPRTRRGHERGLVVAGERPRHDEGANRAFVPTHEARRGPASVAGAEGPEGRDEGGRTHCGPEAQGRLQVRRVRARGRPRLAPEKRMGRGHERSGGQLRRRRARRPGGSGFEVTRRTPARPPLEGRASGGGDRSPRRPRLEIATGACEGAGIRAAGDRLDRGGPEGPRRRDRTQRGGRPADDRTPAIRSMAWRRLPPVRHEGVRPAHPPREAARPERLHREGPADLPEHGLHGDRGRLRPPGVLEFRRALPAARPPGAG